MRTASSEGQIETVIDTAFDFRGDTPPGARRDPDKDSPTLRRYHKSLWSKPLPGGQLFDLSDGVHGHYLYHRSERGEFSLASDSAMQTFTRLGFAANHPELCSKTMNDEFFALAYTIGALMVFPGDQRDGKRTINQARGCLRNIADRMDLTLECIRRHYAGDGSPLAGTLARYGDFFALFENFDGYVNFFLLQDLLAQGESSVAFFMPFDDFRTPAAPKDFGTYSAFRQRSMDFIHARNARIAKYADTLT